MVFTGVTVTSVVNVMAGENPPRSATIEASRPAFAGDMQEAIFISKHA